MRRTSSALSLTGHVGAVAFAAMLLAAAPAATQNAAATPNPAAEQPAGQGTPLQQGTAETQDKCPDPASLRQVRVSAVWRVPPPFEEPTEAEEREKKTTAPIAGRQDDRCRPGTCTDPRRPVVELRDTIGMEVLKLSDLLAQQKCLTEGDGKPRNLVLYLNGRPLPNLVAAPPSDPESATLYFPLLRTEESRDVWTYLLGRPGFRPRKVEVSVGIDDRFAVPSDACFALEAIPLNWFTGWSLIFVVLVVGFFLLASRSDLLRDPVTAPDGARPPFSLARVQAAWWFFLVLAAYLLIGMVTGDFTTSITGTALALLAISAGTVAGSAFVDASKSSASDDRVDAARAKAVWAEGKALEAEISRLRKKLDAGGDVDPAIVQELAEKEATRAEKESTYRKLTRQSVNPLIDLLSDSNGVNFHRFQMLAWTAVLGVFFVADVYRNLAMPQFSETLLGLMGISAGTYLGMKIPENGAGKPIVAKADDPNAGPSKPPAADDSADADANESGARAGSAAGSAASAE